MLRSGASYSHLTQNVLIMEGSSKLSERQPFDIEPQSASPLCLIGFNMTFDVQNGDRVVREFSLLPYLNVIIQARFRHTPLGL